MSSDAPPAASIRQQLVTRLLTEPPVAEAAHLALGALVLVLLWPVAPHAMLWTWIGMVWVLSVVRMLVRRRLAHGEPRDDVPMAFTVSVGAAALAWGLGIALLAPQLPVRHVALVMVVFAGLSAAATTSLVSSPRVYYAFTLALLVPLAAGIALATSTREHYFAVVMVLLFGVGMMVMFRRNHAALVEQLVTSQRLDESRAAAEASEARQRDQARHLAIGYGVARVLAEETDESRVTTEVLRSLCENLDCDVGSLFRVGRSSQRLRCTGFWARPGLNVADFEVLTREMEFGRGEGFLGRVWEAERTLWVEQLRATPAFPRAPAAFKFGASTEIGVPLVDAGHVIGVLEIVSRKRRAEDATLVSTLSAIGAQVGNALARRRAEAELRQAEAEYRQLVEAASEMVWRADVEGQLTFVNQATAAIYHVPPQLVVGRAFTELADGTHQERDRAAFARVVAGEEVRNHESVHLDGDSQPRQVSMSMRPMRNAAGAVIGVHGITRDISEETAARQALHAARDAAEQAAAAKSAFLANMSHEIRTPMNGVLGMAELLLDSDLSDEDRRSVQLIVSSGETLLAIINDILDLSKIEAHQLDLEEVEVDVMQLVESSARLFTPRLRAPDVELAIDVDESLPAAVLSDPTRLRQVLHNLLSNAVKFTHAGEIVVSASNRPRDDGRIDLTFAVRDTGIGIAPDKVQSIFEPFRQADVTTTREFGGTGLGLSIARRLLDLMGGTVEVKSEPGRGSTFSFTVPCRPAERTSIAPPPHADLHGVRVLLVDDNATNRRVTHAAMERAGCRVDEATSATEALECLRAAQQTGEPYKLLVTDVFMPNMDGFTLTERVRATPAVADIATVMVTSAARPGDSRRCRELGVRAFLMKPVPRSELMDALSRALATQAPAERQRTSTRLPATDAGAAGDESRIDGRRRLRVLVAEDNTVNQQVAATMLTRRGHTADVVANGAEAVKAVGERMYDVVLMDLQMPELDGFEATKRIRQHPHGARLPIVAVTANAMPGERERCVAAGMDDYLAKPFKAQELFAVVERERAVDLARFRRDLAEAGAEDAMGQLLSLFLEQAPERLTALQAALMANDLVTAGGAAHALRSAAAAIRADGLAALLARAEAAAKAGDADTVRALAPKVEREYDLVAREVLAEVGPAGELATPPET